jgi:hypothetical protein
MIMVLTRGFTYLGCLLVIVGTALGHVYRWEVIVCALALALCVWLYGRAFKLAMSAIDIQHETIEGQQKLLKDTISELSRRNASGHN